LPEALAPLSRRNAIELSEMRFHADVNRLIKAIEKSFATLVAPPLEPESKDLGVPENLEKAADQGYAQAQNNLGTLYENGEGVPKDLRKAAKLYQKAADQGYALAQNNLGLLYENGEGVPKDLRK